MKFKSTFNYQVSLLFALLVIFSAGCKKDKEKDLTNTQKLTGKTWKTTGLTVSPGQVFTQGGPTITDIYAQQSACEKDNTITFNTNNTYTEDEGGSKCGNNDPQTTTGPWTFNTDQTILTLDNATSITINQLDGTTLKGVFTRILNNTTYTYTITLTRQ